LDEDMETAAVRKLSRLSGWLGIPHSDVFEWHVGIALSGRLRYQQIYQQICRIPTNGSELRRRPNAQNTLCFLELMNDGE
jgi:hypothetical protein